MWLILNESITKKNLDWQNNRRDKSQISSHTYLTFLKVKLFIASDSFSRF
jgi:hypothetical protein